MEKNITHKSYRRIYISGKKIERQIKKFQEKLLSDSNNAKAGIQIKLLKEKKLKVDEQFEIVKTKKIQYLEQLNQIDRLKLDNLSLNYDNLNKQREHWIQKSQLKISPDGKLKTLNKLNRKGQSNAQLFVNKMIKIAEKMKHLSKKIDVKNEKINQISENKLVLLSPFQSMAKFWRSIPYNTQQKIWGYLFVLPWIAGFIIFFLLPILSTLLWSLLDVKPDKGTLAISWAGFSNFKNLFTSYVDVYGNTFARVLSNSLVNLTLNLVIVVIFSLIIAVLLNTKFKCNAFVKAIFFIPVIFNATAIAFATEGLGGRISSSMSGNFTIANDFNNLLSSMSLPDNFTGFLVTAVNQIFTIVNMSGVQILIFLAAIQSVPNNLYEAAKMEGATKYEIFWKITFPMVSPIFLTAAIYTIIDGFARSPILNFYETSKNLSQYGIASAVAVIYFLFTIIYIGIVYYIMKAGLFYHDER